MRFHLATTLALLTLVVANAQPTSAAPDATGDSGAGLGLAERLVVSEPPPTGGFRLFSADQMASLCYDVADYPGVIRALGDLRDDVQRVSGRAPEIVVGTGSQTQPVIVGTVGHSALVDQLVASGRLDVSDLKGKWESFVITSVNQPAPGIDRALVIVGSDKRGTIYGIYELSEQLGVSPWYWWADVPVKTRAAAYVLPGRHASGEPVVKYRGIFLNDEAPALTNWAKEKFGGFNHEFYGHVFELLLRLRANYLWPAMWDSAFNEDDPENPRLADEYGIVMGTSHHEPMMRAQQEWKRHGTGAWDYSRNGETLRKFWTDGIHRNRSYENLVTIGMRGDGDEPMSEEANVALLQRIVADQRTILAQEYGRPPEQIPQLWALYKEVQEYFEKGMRVPDDVTLLWCDDNWGNIRRLPTPGEEARPGGAGVYYHFDYVGGPRSYRWINTNALEKVWEQMHLAWEHEATRIWIVNVGDLKPMEVPIEFFLRYAWDPARWPANSTDAFLRAWATRDFGGAQAAEISGLVDGYSRLDSLCKPELLAPDTFSLVNERESDRVHDAWEALLDRARAIDAGLPAGAHAAFYQLVLYPIEASALVNDLHREAGLDRLYVLQGRASANAHAARVRELFAGDALMTRHWDAWEDGRWSHFMDQIHLGYTTWEQPPLPAMPAVAEVQPSEDGALAIAVEGDPNARPGGYGLPPVARLPTLHAWATGTATTRWFDVFNRGTTPVPFTVEPREPWLQVSTREGVAGPDDVRVEVSVDRNAAPAGAAVGHIAVRPHEGGKGLRIEVPTLCPSPTQAAAAAGAFIELDHQLAIEAPHFSRAVSGGEVTWQVLDHYGRTLGAVTAFPVGLPSVESPHDDSPHLEYAVWTDSSGTARLTLVAAPTQAYVPGRGLRLAISLDDATPQVVDLLADRSPGAWDRMVSHEANEVTTRLSVPAPGRHTLKVWLVDAGVVIERLVLDFGGVKPTYLGPRESPRAP